MFLLQRLVFQKVKKKKKGNVAYTLETKVIKEHLIQYSDLFILESNILFLYYFEYLWSLIFSKKQFTISYALS